MIEDKINELSNRIKILEEIIIKINYTDKASLLRQLYINAAKAFNNYFGVDINTNERKRETVIARQMYYKYLRINTGLSLHEIGMTLLIKQDHSTIIHALNEFDLKVSCEVEYRRNWEKVNDMIKNKQSNK